MSRSRDVSRFLPLYGARGAALTKKSASDFDLEWVDKLVVRAAVYIGSSPPGNPQDGDLWWSTLKGQLYLFYRDDDSTQWVLANSVLGSTGGGNGGGADASHFVGATSPTGALPGDFWFNDTTGKLYAHILSNGRPTWVQVGA